MREVEKKVNFFFFQSSLRIHVHFKRMTHALHLAQNGTP